MNPLEVISNADTMIEQMGITIKDAFTGDEDAIKELKQLQFGSNTDSATWITTNETKVSKYKSVLHAYL